METSAGLSPLPHGGEAPRRTEREDWLSLVLDAICAERDSGNRRALADLIRLAAELVHQGREGRKIGALFVIGDTERLLARSRPLMLDPLRGHPRETLDVGRRELREPVKELAQLDGAFLIEDAGVFVAAGRLIDVDLGVAEGIPMGLGSRHAAAASISRSADAVSVVASQSGVVRVFARGKLVAEVHTELFLGASPSSFALPRPRIYELPHVGLTVAVADRERDGSG